MVMWAVDEYHRLIMVAKPRTTSSKLIRKIKMHKLCQVLSRLFRRSKVTEAQPIVETTISDDQPLPSLESSTQEVALSAVIFLEANPSPIHIPDLPPEMHLEIFGAVDHTTSVYLGLTNKNFYGIYKRLHPIPHELSITNHLCSCWTTAELENPPLPFLLTEWAGSELVFSSWRGKFISKERSQWEHFQSKKFAEEMAKWRERIRQFQKIVGEVRECGSVPVRQS
jgi:hypothetical protein